MQQELTLVNGKRLVFDRTKTKLVSFSRDTETNPKYYFDLQTSTHALMFIVHHLECVRLSALMKLAVFVMKTALPTMTQCALRMEQHMTTNAGMSCTTVEDWRIIWCITQEAVRVRMRLL